jgi:hypothetical protein
MARDGSSRGDWLRVSMRTPGASPDGSPTFSPEQKAGACLHDSMSPSLSHRLDDWDAFETTLGTMPSAPDHAEAAHDEANPRARFVDEISLDCADDEPSNQPMQSLSAQQAATADQSQLQIHKQDTMHGMGKSAASQGLVGQTTLVHATSAPQTAYEDIDRARDMPSAGRPQLPSLGCSQSRNTQLTEVGEVSSLGRGLVLTDAAVQRTAASHCHLPSVDRHRMTASGAVQSCNMQSTCTEFQFDNRGATMQQPKGDAQDERSLQPTSQQPAHLCSLGGSRQLHSLANIDEYNEHRAYGEAGHHQHHPCAAAVHESGRLMLTQRQCIGSQSFQRTQPQIQQLSYNAAVRPVPYCMVVSA